MSKVAIVGVEGSGKTVLMGALCESYKKISDGTPYLMPENQAAFMFMERIPHKLRVEREWPEATNLSSLKSMRWTLRCGSEILEEIEMLDYPGELYRIAFGEHKKDEAESHREELNEFLRHVTDADFLIVLLSLADLQNLGANSRNAETVWITRGIFDFAKKLPNIKRTLLVFTQADRFEATLNANGGAQGLYAKQLPMLKTLYPDLKVIAVSAVSGMDGDGRPKKDYSTAGCLELMREVLAEHDAVIMRCLGLCESCLVRVNEFSCGSPEGFSAEVTAYSNAVADFAKASKPLTQVYAERVKWNQTEVSNLSHLVSVILSLCSGASADVLANCLTWAGLRETYEAYGSLFDAFLKHYKAEVKRLKQIAVDEEENAKKRAIQEAKDKRNGIIGVVCVGALIAGIIGLAFYSDWSAKRNAWEKAKAEYETAVKEVSVKITGQASETESRSFLNMYGGEKWNKAQAFAALGNDLKWKDLHLGKSHFESASALMKDLTGIVMDGSEREKTAQRLEESRRRDEADRAVAARRAEEKRIEENRIAKLREAAAERDAKVSEYIGYARSAALNGSWPSVISNANRALEMESGNAEAVALKNRGESELENAKRHEEMLERTVESAIVKAREAKSSGNWKQCAGYANDVLAIRQYHREALRLKADAEEGLLPRLVLQAETNGSPVVAQVTDGQNTYSTPKAFVLKKGARYAFCVSFSSGTSGTQYSDEALNIVADWEGMVTQTVGFREAPILKVCAEVTGKEVEAEVSDGVSLYKTPRHLILKRGKEYVLSVKYNDSTAGVRYAKSIIRVRADWEGNKTETVVLGVDHGPLPGENWISPATGMEFIWVPALNLWVGKYEVTNGEYRKHDKSHSTSCSGDVDIDGDRQPVANVAFRDAKDFAEWLTDGDKERLFCRQYRLPTDDEWTIYAQCGDGRKYPWGNSMPPLFGNYADKAYGKTIDDRSARKQAVIIDYDDRYVASCDVRKSGANPWGLYGVGGNVWECCAKDAQGNTFGSYRGASWMDNNEAKFECSNRGLYNLCEARSMLTGFRLVLTE